MLGNNIAELSVLLTVSSAGLKHGLAQAEMAVKNSSDKMIQNLNRLSNVMLGLGTTLAGALIGATAKYAAYSDEIEEMSQRTGIGTGSLQEFKYAAEQTGASLSGLETGIKKMNSSISTLRDTEKDAANETVKIKKGVVSFTKAAVPTLSALQKLGFAFGDLEKLSVEERFTKIITALSGVQDEGERSALAVEIFGRAGTDLLPMLNDGSAGLQQMRDAARSLGLVLDETSIKKGGRLADSFKTMQDAWDALVRKIGSSTAFQDLITKMTNLISKFVEWADKSPTFGTDFLNLAKIIIELAVAVRAAAFAMALFQAFLPGAGWVSALTGLAVAGTAFASLNYMFGQIDAMPTPADPRGTPVWENGEITGYSRQGLDSNSINLYIDGEQVTDVIEKRLYNRVNTGSGKSYG